MAAAVNLLVIPTDSSINQSLELKCLLDAHAEQLNEDADRFCPTHFDTILCWPRTPKGSLATLPCLAELSGVHYDISKNASRHCHQDGNWDNYTNYDLCIHVPESSAVSEFEPNIELPTIVYYIGYSLSLISLTLAVAVFVHFKDLRCLRNTIHANLFLTYMLSGLLWILTLSLQISGHPSISSCIFLVTLFHYFSLTSFFWMLVEGLYLYMLVVETFSGDNLRFSMYATIGWGGPALFVLSWAIIKAFAVENENLDGLAIECTWMRETNIDWIFQGPACAVLIINLIFLCRIMWVLITKLRSANTLETRQYRKATKALLVLIPLLGITYLVVMAGPNEGVGSHIFAVARALLLSTQRQRLTTSKMQLTNGQSDLVAKDMSSQVIRFKYVVWLTYNKIILPFESKWPWTLHLGGTVLSVVYCLVLLYSHASLILQVVQVVFIFEMATTLTTPTKDRILYGVNVIIFCAKLIFLVVCFVVHVISGATTSNVIFYVSMFLLELSTGSLYLKFLYPGEYAKTEV